MIVLGYGTLHHLPQCQEILSLAEKYGQVRLEQFDFNFNPRIPTQHIRDLATCRFIERKESIILCGPVGVGKTHLA